MIEKIVRLYLPAFVLYESDCSTSGTGNMLGRSYAPLSILVFALVPSASTVGEEANIPEQYKPFQGRWKVTSNVKVAPIKLDLPEIYVDVVGRSFVLHGADVAANYRRSYGFRVPGDGDMTPYQYLQERGTGDLAYIVDTPHQIAVFWFVGIYRFKGNRLELCLRYCGQGVEGEAAKKFRPPTSFRADQPKDTGVVILERVPVDSNVLHTAVPDGR